MGPPNIDTLLRTLGAIRKWQRSHRTNFQLTLLHPAKLPPSHATFEAVTDLYSHPFLQDKWTTDMHSRFILWEPGAYTFSGKIGPISTNRPLIGATFSAHDKLDICQEVIHWKPYAARLATGMTILVDTSTHLLPAVEKTLSSAQLPFHITWESADTSLSSSKDQPRATLKGYLSDASHTELTAILCCRQLRAIITFPDTYIGRQDTYMDHTALLAEVTHWSAWGHFSHLYDDLVPVSPRFALLKTRAPPTVWHKSLTDTMHADPSHCVLKIKWRSSTHGGRPWATPAATATQLQAVRSQAQATLQGRQLGIGRDLESEIAIQGPAGPDPESILRSIMEEVSKAMGCPLTQRPEGNLLAPGEWHTIQDKTTGNTSGRIKILPGHARDVQLLENAVHAQPILIGSDTRSLRVTNLAMMHIPAPQQYAKGGQRDTGCPP